MKTEPTNSFAALAASAQSQSDNWDSASNYHNDHQIQQQKDYSHRAYMKELKRVIDLSDVILMVLDARDPLGSTSSTIEREIRRREGEGKKLVWLLNKIDLVPKSNVEQWLNYLRTHYPTVAFKANTQQQRQNLSQKKMSNNSSSSTSDCLGADSLINLLKNYTRNANIKTSIVCGIIGFPNVGKSSIVNSLKRSRACGVGATPGFTKVAQEVVLDKNIKILDSPGVVFADENSYNNNDDDDAAIKDDEAKLRRKQAEITLKNVIKVENVDDPLPSIELILERCNKEHLQQLYEIPEFDNITDFLVKISFVRGRLTKGGVPDLVGSARSVLRDYTTGRIPYYTQPPSMVNSSSAKTLNAPQSTLSSAFYPKSTKEDVDESAIIVTEYGHAFDLESLMGQSDAQTLSGAGSAMFETLPKKRTFEEGNGNINNEGVVDMIDNNNDNENNTNGIVSLPPKKKVKNSVINSVNQNDRMFDVDEQQQFSMTNPMSRQNQKKARKQETKARMKAGALPMSGAGGEGELMKALNGLDVKMDESNDGERIQDDDDEDIEQEHEDIDEGFDGGRSGYGMNMFNVQSMELPQQNHNIVQNDNIIDDDEEL